MSSYLRLSRDMLTVLWDRVFCYKSTRQNTSNNHHYSSNARAPGSVCGTGRGLQCVRCCAVVKTRDTAKCQLCTIRTFHHPCVTRQGPMALHLLTQVPWLCIPRRKFRGSAFSDASSVALHSPTQVPWLCILRRKSRGSAFLDTHPVALHQD